MNQNTPGDKNQNPEQVGRVTPCAPGVNPQGEIPAGEKSSIVLHCSKDEVGFWKWVAKHSGNNIQQFTRDALNAKARETVKQIAQREDLPLWVVEYLTKEGNK